MMSGREAELREIRNLLVRTIQEAGGVSQWARTVGLDRAHVSKALHGHRVVGPKIVRALGGKDISADPCDVRRLLRDEVKKAGGQSEWARRTGVNRVTVSKVIHGERKPTPDVLRALKIPRYRIDR
jgi:DNA-binding phage protein